MAEFDWNAHPEVKSDNSFNWDAHPVVQAPVAVETKKPSTSVPEAIAMGFAKGSNFGMQDETEGALGGVSRGFDYLRGKTSGDKSLLDSIRTGYLTDRDASRAYDKQLSDEHPIASFAGEIGSALPQFEARAPLTLGKLALQGAVSGFGNSEDISNQPADIAQGALTAGALGKVGEGIGNGISSILNKIKIQEALKALGAQKTQLKGMPESFKNDTAQYALDNGLINPLQGVTSKQNAANQIQRNTGQRLESVRDTLPSIPAQDASNAINSRMSFNPNLEVNSPLTAQRDLMLKDIGNLTDKETGNINAKDLLDLKSALFNMSRKANGEINPGKDILEQGRKGISSLEKDVAGSGAYSEDLKNYAMGKKIEQFLNNKSAQSGNSVLGMGGLAGGAGALGALATGHPGIATLGLLGVPAVRSKIGETSSLSIQVLQQLAQKLGISPDKAALLLSKVGQ